MRSFNEWNQLHNLKGEVTLSHCLFGKQSYKCDTVQIINDEKKIGVLIKGEELFVDKQKVVEFCVNEDNCMVRDELLKIIINKL